MRIACILLLLAVTIASISSSPASTSLPLVDFIGKYEVLAADDFEKGISKRYTLLRDLRSNKTYNVHAASDQDFSSTRSGSHVRVKGSIVEQPHDGVGLVTHGDIHVRNLEVVAAPPPSASMKLHRLVFLLINLGKFDLECTPTFMRSVVEGPAGWNGGLIGLTERDTMSAITYSDDLHADNSVDIFGPYTIKFDGTCNADLWAQTVLDAARTDGVDISAYQHRAFVLPGVNELYSACGWHGLGNVGCDICNIWVADCATVEVFLHELGHNLGLPHAGSNWYQQGNTVEYGDITSVMGNGWWGSKKDITWYNLPEIEYLMNFTIEVTYVERSGSFQISPYNLLPGNVNFPQGIKVRHPINGHLFYFSFNSNASVNFANEIVVHEFTNQGSVCYFIRNLPLGDTFQDNLNRLTVTPVFFDNATYVLEVNFGCVVVPTQYSLTMHSKSGSLDVTDADGLLLSSGSFDFTLQVFNGDSPLCTPTTYFFASEGLPTDWGVNFSPPSLFLVPGQDCSISFSVVVPDSAENGFYPILISGLATSGFDAPEHNLSIPLNTTLGPLDCVPRPPTLSITSTPGNASTKYVDYIATIRNRDGFGCTPVDFTVTVQYPWEFTLFNKEMNTVVKVGPGETSVIALQFTLLHDNIMYRAFYVNITSDTHDMVTEEAFLPPMAISPCQLHTPAIQILQPTLTLQTRSAESVVVTVMNMDSLACAGSTFFFTAVPPTAPSGAVRITLNPPSMFLLPGQRKQFYLMVAVPIYQQAYNLSIPVEAERVQNGEHFYAADYLSLFISPPPCVIEDLGYASWCQNDGDLSDGWIQCAGLIVNHDSWNCPYLQLRVQALLPPGPGWSADFETGQFMQYEPTNGTWYWVNITAPPQLPPGSYEYWFYGGEQKNQSLHAFNSSYTLNTCNKNPLGLKVDSSANTAVLGQTTTYSAVVSNTDSVFCEGRQVEVGVEVGADMKGLLNFAVSRSTFSASHGSNSNVYISTTVPLGVKPLNVNATERTFNFNLTITDAKNETFYLVRIPLSLTVILNCTITAPYVQLVPIDNTAAIPGDASSATYTLTITNTDAPLCPGTTFNANFGAPSNFFPPSGFNSFLNPNQSVVTNVTFGISDNIPPGLFSVMASASDGESTRHSSSGLSNYSIGCPTPRPVFNLSATQFTPFLRTKTAILLSWNACENPIWCCCPCTWEVYRDGKKIATSPSSNYTDLDRPAGSQNVYSAITIDSRGIISPTTTTCTVSVAVKVQPPDLTNLYIFIALVIASAGWVFGCGTLLYMFRKSVQMRLDGEESSGVKGGIASEEVSLLHERGEGSEGVNELVHSATEIWKEEDNIIGDEENENEDSG